MPHPTDLVLEMNARTVASPVLILIGIMSISVALAQSAVCGVPSTTSGCTPIPVSLLASYGLAVFGVASVVAGASSLLRPILRRLKKD